MKFFYQMLIGHFRNLLLAKVVDKSYDLLDLGEDEIAGLKKQTEGVSRETLQRLLDMVMSEEESVRKSQNARINLETILVSMAYLDPMIPIDTILSRMEGLENRLVSGGATQSALSLYEVREAQAPSSQERALLSVAQSGMVDEVHCGYDTGENKNSGDIWEDYKAFVKKQSYPLWSKIETGKLLSYEFNCLRIGFHKDRIFLLDDTDRGRLTDISKEFFTEDVSVKIELLESGSENGQHQNSHGSSYNNRINDVKRDALNHPLLQKVLDVFEGAVVREVNTRVDNEQ
jgi:DNA polymerase-3 subunit gamma/tau